MKINSKTIDIHSKGYYPSNVLSNFYRKPFTIEGKRCNSIEGFIQGLREKDQERQSWIFLLNGPDAKLAGLKIPIKNGILYWNGQPMYRESDFYLNLLRQAFEACFKQNEEFRSAINHSKNYVLTHSIGKSSTKETLLTESEFINLLTNLRNFL